MQQPPVDPSSADQQVGAAALAQRVAGVARARPDAVAVSDASSSLTYADLLAGALAVAGHLAGAGVGPGERVAVELDRSAAAVVSLVGVLLSGGAWVPLDPAQPAARRAAVVERAGVRAVLLAGERDAGEYVAPALARAAVAAGPALAEPVPAGPDDVAYVLFTSGSTGEPKGVEVTHRGVAALLDWSVGVLDDDDVSRLAACVSFTFDPSVVDIFSTLLRGGQLVVLRDALDPALADSACTALSVTPSALRELVRARRLPSTLRTALVGGEVLEPSVAEAFFDAHPSARIIHCYGPTEVTVTTAAQELRRGFSAISLGRELPGLRALVLDEAMAEVPAGEAGELCVAGAQVARGYLGDAEQTAERFVAWTSPAGEHLRVYRTGDRVRRAVDGDLQFLGRLDRQVKVRGYRVELDEVEGALRSAPGVQLAAVALAGSGASARLVAWCSLQPGAPAAERTLLDHVAAQLPAYMVPSSLEVVDRMPLTSAGKADVRALLADLEPAPVAAPGPVDALSVEELPVARVVAEVVGLPELPGPDDMVIGDLGATSLQLLEVTTKLGRLNGVAPAVSSTLADASVADLAALIAQAPPSRQGGGRGAPAGGGTPRRWWQRGPLSAAGRAGDGR